MGHITNTTSTLFGYFARFRFPKIIQIVVNKAYASMFKIDLSEFDELNSYDSLNALFTRKLKTPRKISDQTKDIISPCDGLITQVGKISSSKALQIKAREYDIKTLLTQYSLFASKYSSRFEDGHYMNFYLSPKDYHCYHSPCDLTIHKSIHISGRLFPVNLKFLLTLQIQKKEQYELYEYLELMLNLQERILRYSQQVKVLSMRGPLPMQMVNNIQS